MQPEKNHATPPHTKIMQPLHTQNHATSQQKILRNLSTKINHAASPQNIARIAKRCPENITSVVRCIKLLFPKVLRKFFFFTVVTAVTVVRVLKTIMKPFHKNLASSHFLNTFSVLLKRAI